MMFGSDFLVRSLLEQIRGASEFSEKYAEAYVAKTLEAKQTEVDFLKAQIEDLRKQVVFEQGRCTQLMDRLLVRDAKVSPVGPLAVSSAEEAFLSGRKPPQEDVLKEMFDSISSVGQEVDMPTPTKVVFAGGGEAVRDNHNDTAS